MGGQTVWAAVVAPYGLVDVREGAAFAQPLRWPGHYADVELGLHYNRFRTYAPYLGRYLEPDPLGRGGGLENVYAYTHNPLFRVDTHGLADPCPHSAKKKEDEENEEEGKNHKEELKAARKAANDKVQALKKANAPEKAVMDARYERYLIDCKRKGTEPSPRSQWEPKANIALQNKKGGSEAEEKALASLDVANNNKKGATTFDKDGDKGTKTRPDAVTDNALIDVKSAPKDGKDGKRNTVNDSPQLRAQRDAANGEGKNHVVVISSEDRDNVRPSGPLAEDPPKGSTVVHHDPKTNKWSTWDGEANQGKGGWTDSSADAVNNQPRPS